MANMQTRFRIVPDVSCTTHARGWWNMPGRGKGRGGEGRKTLDK